MKYEKLKYKVIKSKRQYKTYCMQLEELLASNRKSDSEEVELLTLLIEKWDEEHNSFEELDPIELIKTLMLGNNLKAKDLVNILDLSKSTISKILNYQKGLSKETIRKLSHHFRVSQEAFNRPYKLKNAINRKFKNASLMNTRKNINAA